MEKTGPDGLGLTDCGGRSYQNALSKRTRTHPSKGFKLIHGLVTISSFLEGGGVTPFHGPSFKVGRLSLLPRLGRRRGPRLWGEHVLLRGDTMDGRTTRGYTKDLVETVSSTGGEGFQRQRFRKPVGLGRKKKETTQLPGLSFRGEVW